ARSKTSCAMRSGSHPPGHAWWCKWTTETSESASVFATVALAFLKNCSSGSLSLFFVWMRREILPPAVRASDSPLHAERSCCIKGKLWRGTPLPALRSASVSRQVVDDVEKHI